MMVLKFTATKRMPVYVGNDLSLCDGDLTPDIAESLAVRLLKDFSLEFTMADSLGHMLDNASSADMIMPTKRGILRSTKRSK